MGTCLCANDLNRYVTIQRLNPAATPDAGGHINETIDANWMNVGTEWCQIITQGSREFVVGQQLDQQITHQVSMRFSPSATKYTTKFRLTFEGRILNFAGPPQNVDEKDKWLRFPAFETPSV